MTRRRQQRTTHEHGSLTPAGTPRTWTIETTSVIGSPMPCLEPYGFQVDGVRRDYVTDRRGHYTEAHARRELASFRRWYDEISRANSPRAHAERRKSGEIYTGPTALSWHESSRSGLRVGESSTDEPDYTRYTAVTRTRDGVTYTDEILVVDEPVTRLPK